MSQDIDVELHTDAALLWKALSNQAYESLAQAISELIDNSISSMDRNIHDGHIGEIHIELTNDTLVITDNGHWKMFDKKTLANLLSFGEVSVMKKKNLNEHNCGLKQSIAFMDPTNTKWSISISHNGKLYVISAPWSNKLKVVYKGATTENGTKIMLPMTDALLRTLYRKNVSCDKKVNIERVIENLYQILRVNWMFNENIKRGDIQIKLNNRRVYPLDIFDAKEYMSPEIVHSETMALDDNAKQVRLTIYTCKVEKTNTDRHFFKRSTESQGVYIYKTGRKISGPLMNEVYGVTPDNHYNHHIVFACLDSKDDDYSGLPSTTTVKNNFNRRDPKYETLINIIHEKTFPAQTRRQYNSDVTEAELNKQLKDVREMCIVEMGGKIVAFDETLPLRLDGDVLMCSDRYDVVEEVGDKLRIYEGKLAKPMSEHIWQLFRYFIQIKLYVTNAKSIECILVSSVSKEPDESVRDTVRIIQQRCPEFQPLFKLYRDYRVGI